MSKEITIDTKYSDPTNTEEILVKLRGIPRIAGVKRLVDELYPDWFVTVLPDYSDDYPHLRDNWYKLCHKMNVNPAQIMIVSYLSGDSHHSLLSNFAECFTRAGFSVRRKNEYLPCVKCNRAIPSQMVYNLFREKGFTVPEVYSTKCTNC
jgi:hypothetical protein